MSTTAEPPVAPRTLDRVIIRFAGDSGDGMQLTGDRFTSASALLGNDLVTLPEYPAEIRAPAGTVAGVSAFQVHISDHDITTPGDAPNVLVAMNPAALRSEVGKLEPGATVILNVDAFDERALAKAGYDHNPLETDDLKGFTVYEVPMTSLTRQACEPLGVKPRDAERSKNFFALGLISWMYTRPEQPTIDWINSKFGSRPQVRDANLAAFNAGHAFGETAELFDTPYVVEAAPQPAGVYTSINGNTATAWGLIAAGQKAQLPVFLGSYPITPASDILHELSKHKNFGVRTFQAEDEIAGIGSALGAAYGGHLGVTTTSGPGVALKAETIGLAISLELPLVIIDVQRGGPSTGLPTKTEQADLLMAMYGHHGESPAADRGRLLAGALLLGGHRGGPHRPQVPDPRLPAHRRLPGQRRRAVAHPRRVDAARDRGAVRHLDQPRRRGRHRRGCGPTSATRRRSPRRGWCPAPPTSSTASAASRRPTARATSPTRRTTTSAMVELRAAKIAGIADDIPLAEVVGDVDDAEVLVVGWGSTWGAINGAVDRVRASGHRAAQVQLTHLNPFPPNLGEIVRRYPKVVVPEMNMGQLSRLLRAEFLVDARSVHKVKGLPFTAGELETAILGVLDD